MPRVSGRFPRLAGSETGVPWVVGESFRRLTLRSATGFSQREKRHPIGKAQAFYLLARLEFLVIRGVW